MLAQGAVRGAYENSFRAAVVGETERQRRERGINAVSAGLSLASYWAQNDRVVVPAFGDRAAQNAAGKSRYVMPPLVVGIDELKALSKRDWEYIAGLLAGDGNFNAKAMRVKLAQAGRGADALAALWLFGGYERFF